MGSLSSNQLPIHCLMTSGNITKHMLMLAISPEPSRERRYYGFYS